MNGETPSFALRLVEAFLFASSEPVTEAAIAELEKMIASKKVKGYQ